MRYFLLCLFAAVLLNGAVKAQSTPNYPKIKKGLYQIVNIYTGKAAGVDNYSRVIQKKLQEDIAQEWQFDLQPDGTYKITSQEGGKVLQVKAGSKQPGAAIEQGNWDNKDSQKWYVRSSPKGHLILLNKNSNYYLAIPSGAKQSVQVLQVKPTSHPICEWKLTEVK